MDVLTGISGQNGTRAPAAADGVSLMIASGEGKRGPRALDSANAEAVMRMIRTACKRGVAVVVTHDAQLASWADRVVLIRDGRIVEQTAPAPGPESLLGQDR